MANIHWNGDAAQKIIRQTMERRIKAACTFLSTAIKADISQPGTLRYNPTNRNGSSSKRQKKIYNFTHSRPFNPPFKQTGHLRRSVTYEVVGLVGRVGTNFEYGKALELGTTHMAPRPFILPTFIKHRGTLTAIITGSIQPGGLPEIAANQSRSGHLGAGAYQAGYE